MKTHAHTVQLAQLCALNARNIADSRAAEELWKMALEYQEKAATMNSGRKPEIGPPPDHLKRPS
jgi:hypothetical protein